MVKWKLSIELTPEWSWIPGYIHGNFKTKEDIDYYGMVKWHIVYWCCFELQVWKTDG